MSASSETRDIASPAFTRLPRHVAIVMDGNGRWAQERGRRRSVGHRVGARSIREITEECARLGLDRLTLYAFSAENWKRPKTEIRFLMTLLARYLVKERRTILENNVQLAAIGRIHELPTLVQKRLAELIEVSSRNTGLTLCLALNYGGRTEIVDAARRAMELALDGKLDPDQLDERAFADLLYAGPGVADPDLLIRTGGDCRVSNFLLWEISYAEIYVTDTRWPDFRAPQLHDALRDYERRDRRFGGLND